MPSYMKKEDVIVLLCANIASSMLDRHGETEELNTRIVDRAEGMVAELERRGIVAPAEQLSATELYGQLQKLGQELSTAEVAQLAQLVGDALPDTEPAQLTLPNTEPAPAPEPPVA